MKSKTPYGTNDRSVAVTSGGEVIYEYKLWWEVQSRCFNKFRLERNPAYLGCNLSENFLKFSYFREWCNNQIGFGNEDWRLDKDILVKGNKVYSENTCVFVPIEINNLILSHRKKRGAFPIGVSYCKNNKRFKACVRKNAKKKTIGYFNTPEEAFQAYKEAKEAYIKEVANKWKDQIDPRAYEALMNWTVEDTD